MQTTMADEVTKKSREDRTALIRALLAKLEALNLGPFRLECDGMTRCISALLADAGIEHMVHLGQLSAEGKKTVVHYWIELESGELVDLCARAWMGDSPKIPHGVFRHPSGVTYTTSERLFPHQFAASDFLFQVLTGHTFDEFKGPAPAHQAWA